KKRNAGTNSSFRPSRLAAERLCVQRVFQALAGLELRLGGSRDIDFGAGSGITALGGLALGGGKGAETHQAHFIAALQGSGDRLEDSVDSSRSLSLVEIGLLCDGGAQIVLVHSVSSLSIARHGRAEAATQKYDSRADARKS